MIEPNQTLYIKNIDWKIKKGLLKRALYSLFTRHGKVLEIIVLRRAGLRGQAWVIMGSVEAATAALAEQGFTFFGKDLVIEYAREKSDRIAKREGTYVPKAKRHKIQKSSEPEEEEEQQEEAEEEEPDDSPPSKYLLAHIPPECGSMLQALFGQYAGLVEVRLAKPELAFVEFESEPHATAAKKALQGFQLTKKNKLKLQYGKE
jgi:U2 small nuclear ribonucleoprotein B''